MQNKQNLEASDSAAMIGRGSEITVSSTFICSREGFGGQSLWNPKHSLPAISEADDRGGGAIR